MNILTTIPDYSLPAWQAVVDKYNAGSGKEPVTIEQFAQIFRAEETARYVAAKEEADKIALAADSELMEIGRLVLAASPEKKASAISAAQAALSAE